MSDDTAASPADGAPEHSLVEIAPGFGVLLGPSLPAGLELIDSAPIPSRAAEDITSTMSKIIGATNVGSQALMTQVNLQGIVRLAPETMKALETARPLTTGGVNLGTLVDSSGHFAHSVRWVPANGVKAATALSSLGPSLSMLAMQVQLAEMQSLIQDNLDLTRTVLQESRNERWAAAAALRETLLQALEEAKHVGTVTDGIWQNVAAREESLRRVQDRARRDIADHIKALASKRGHAERRKFLEESRAAIREDLMSLLSAQQSWFIYQGLRVGHLYAQPVATEANDALIAKIIDTANEEWDRGLSDAHTLARALHQQFSTLAELPGKRTMPVGRARNARKRVTGSSREFLQDLESIERMIGYQPPTHPVARLPFNGSDQSFDAARGSLRWELDDSEELLALVTASEHGGTFDGDSYVAVTAKRILVAQMSDVDRYGGPWQSFPTSDIRYVKSSGTCKSSDLSVDIYFPDEEIHLSFGLFFQMMVDDAQSWADKLIQLFRSFMNLPSEEVPPSPIEPATPENDAPSMEPAPSPRLLDS